MSRVAAISFLWLALASGSPAATTYFVDAARSDDSGAGTSWETAKRTIQAAVNLSSSGDGIFVTNGVYAPIITADRNITIASVGGPDVTIIDGGGSARCAFLGWEDLPRHTVLEGFTLRNGSAEEGGGAYGGTLMDCLLTNNVADIGGGAFGSTLIDCTLVGNVAETGGGGSASGTLTDCLVEGNTAPYGGGAGYGILVRSILKGNSATYGGAFYGDVPNGGTLANCLLIGNTAENGGGACGGTLVNCTVADNTASRGGGFFGGGIFGGLARNTIVVGNTATTASNNCYAVSLQYSCSAPQQSGAGNIAAPTTVFVDAPNGDYRLVEASACLDAGNNAFVPAGTDLAGYPRVINATVDIGAYEYLSNIPVTFQPEGGNPPVPASKQVTYAASYGPLALALRTGYTFDGWWTGASGTGTEVTSNTTVTATNAHALYARWTPNTYPVFFDPQGGTSPVPASRLVTYDAPYGSLATSTRSGYHLIGWRTAPEGSGDAITPESIVAFTESQTLYAHWIPNPYMVTADSYVVGVGNTNAVNLNAQDSGNGDGSIRLGGPGLLADGEMAGIEWTVVGPGRLSFKWKTSSEDEWDWLSFHEVKGSVSHRLSGTATNWVDVSVDVIGADDAWHTFRWEYRKDPFGDFVGEDAGWVDAISWMPFYEVVVTGGTGDGLYVQGEVVGIAADAPPTGQRFDRWTGDTNHVANVFSASTTLTVSTSDVLLNATYRTKALRSLEVVNGSGSGLYLEDSIVEVVADPAPLYQEFDRWVGTDAAFLNDVTAQTAYLTMPTEAAVVTATYRVALDRVAGSAGREFTVDGTAGGVTASTNPVSPSATPSLQLGGAGIVPDGGFVALETVVQGSGTIAFWWSVSSQSGADFLRFLVDGVEIAAISGTKQPWRALTNRVEGAGSHVLRWEYVKDDALASSTDAGWVDDIVWTGDVPSPAFAPEIIAFSCSAATNALTFLGERGIPYNVMSNAMLRTEGWGVLARAPEATGETNGVPVFDVLFAMPTNQPTGFYRVDVGE